jgi:hypothetical protein
MSKARDIANILSASTSIATDAEVTSAISAATTGLATASSVSTAVTNERSASATLTNKTIDGNDNTTHVKRGTTGNRPGSAVLGDQYFDTDEGVLYNYKSTGWTKVSQDPPPKVMSISPTTSSTSGTTISISGTDFKSGATVQFIGTDSVTRNAVSVTSVSSVLLNATTPQLPVAYEPYDVKVINPDNLSSTISGVLDAGGTPVWSTSSGNLITVNAGASVSTSVSASDPDGNTISYSSTNIPGWLSLNSSTGSITGTAASPSSTTVYTFDITASDGTNTSTRSFSVTSYVWSSQLFSGGTAYSSSSTAFTNLSDSSLTTESTSWSGSNNTSYFGGSQSIGAGGWGAWECTANSGTAIPSGEYAVVTTVQIDLSSGSNGSHDGMYVYAYTPSSKYKLFDLINPPYPVNKNQGRVGLFTLPSSQVTKIKYQVADGSSAWAMGGRTYNTEIFKPTLVYAPAPNAYTLVEETGHSTTGDGTLGSYSNGSSWPGTYSGISSNNVIGFRFTSPTPAKYWVVDYSAYNITRVSDLQMNTSTVLNRDGGLGGIYNPVTSTSTPGKFYIACTDSTTSFTLWLTCAGTLSTVTVNSIKAYA